MQVALHHPRYHSARLTVTNNMGALDNFLVAVAPKFAAQRFYYRAMANEALAYEAAGRGRHSENWRTKNGSANAENGMWGLDLELIRERVRDLVRNNSYAARAMDVLPASIVDTGIVPRLDTKDKTLKQQVRDDWNRFSDNCDPEGLSDFYGLQHLAIRTALESGEAYLQWLPRKSDAAFPLQVRVLEPDYIDMRQNKKLPDGGCIVHGVEFDKSGKRVAYWMFDEHQGDALITGYVNVQSKRVDARYITPIFNRQRAGQVHGVPILAPAVMRLKDIQDYDTAEIRRKKIESSFAAFIQRAAGPSGTLGASSTASGNKVETVKTGTLAYLSAGEEVKFGNPSHVQGYADYMRVQLMAIASGIGCNYAQLTGDLSNANYSSARIGLLDYNRLINRWQWNTAIQMMCRPAWNKFQEVRSVLHGDKGQGQAIWATPKREWLNPVDDIRAEKEAIRNGMNTLPESIAARGEDPDDVLGKIAESNKQIDDLGLILDCDPRRTAGTGNPVPKDQQIDNNGVPNA